MKDDTSIQASMWLLVALQTIGAVDPPGKGPRKLPAPRAYVAVVVAWSTLHIMSDAGAGRAAAAAGWLMVLAAAVLGPFGTTAVNLLNTVADRYGVTPIGKNASNTNPQSPPGTVSA